MKTHTVGMILDKVFPPDIRVEKEASALLRAGYKVHLICRNGGDDLPFADIDGLKVHRIEYFPPRYLGGYFPFFHLFLYDRKWLKEITALGEKEKFDFLHVHDLPLVLTAVRAATQLKIPLIFDMHENWPEGVKIWMRARRSPILYIRDTLRNFLFYNAARYKRLEKKCLKKAQRIIVVIDEQKERLITLGVAPNHITIVKNTSDKELLQQMRSENTLMQNRYASKFVIVYVGGFSFARGLDILLNAVARAKTVIENIHLILVGDGNARFSLEHLVHCLGLAECVEFTGWVDFTRVPDYISVSDICVVPHNDSPHTRTTIPHKLFQYMAMGKPVITTAVGPLQRIVAETRCGIIVRAGDAQEMEEAIYELQNRELAEQLGRNGLNAIAEKYNWNYDAQQLITMYDSLSEL